MLADSPSPRVQVAREIELRGHIIDSGIFSRVLGFLTDHEDVDLHDRRVAIGQHTVEEQRTRA